MLLRLTGVAKFYGSRLVIRDVSFEAVPGSVTLLAGPNGAGKSTLLKLMAGLSRPSAGSVERGAACECPGYLGHQTFLYPELTAFENLAFWAHLHDLAPEHRSEKALLAALDRMELQRFAFERAGGFSRGMAQRLNLARVLLLAPPLLLLDEPGTGLDTRSTGILHREIDAARDRGAGIVWISHSVAQDIGRADHVLAIAEKRVTYSGPAAGYAPEAMAC